MVIIGYLFIILIVILFWWCFSCYFGNSAATFLTIILIAITLVALNWFDNLPTNEELKQYERHKRNIGQ